MARRPDSRRLSVLITAIALLAAALHLWQTATYNISSGQFKNLHVGLSLLVVYLTLAEAPQSNWRRRALLALAALCLLPLIYIHLEFDALVSERLFESSFADSLVAVVLITTTIAAVALQWGLTIPLIAVSALLYAYFGAWMPGALLFHPGIDLSRLLSYASIPFFQGILGSLTSMSASIVFIFMLFAGGVQSRRWDRVDHVRSARDRRSVQSRARPRRCAE